MHQEQIQHIKEFFKLQEHPEGGAYRENYRCKDEGEFKGMDRLRSISTGIYFLLNENEKSHFHRIKSDEMWHFYLGGPLEILEINEDGNLFRTIIGRDFLKNEKLQYVVKAGNWFAATPLKGSHYSFVGCTVAPGFDYKDFELATRDYLLKEFPQHQDTILHFTP